MLRQGMTRIMSRSVSSCARNVYYFAYTPILQWARERRNAEQERDSDFGPDDYFEGALRGGHRGEYEGHDEFGETMLLVALCLAVSVLLYVRTRLVERVRRETEGNGANNNNNNGDGQQQPAAAAFPPGPDPNWGML